MTKIPLPVTASPTLTDAAVRPTANAQSVTATLINPPQAVARLPAGAIIAGLVLNRDATGATQVRTSNGTLVLQSRSPIEPGSSISLKFQAESGGNRSLLVSITTQPPQAASAPQAAPAAAGPAAPQSGTSGAPAPTTATPAGEAASAAPPPRPAAIIEDHPPVLARVIKGGAPESLPRAAGSGPPPAPTQVPAALRPVLGNGSAPAFRPGAELIIRIAAVEAAPPSAVTPATSATPNAAQAAAAPPPATGLVSLRPVAGSGHPPAPFVPTLPSSSPAATRPGPAYTASPSANLVPPPVGPAPSGAAPAPSASPSVPGPAPTATPTGAPATHASTAAPAAPSHGLLPAVVIGQSVTGEPVLQTAFGQLSLALKAELPAGTRAALEVVAARATAAPLTGAPATQLSGLDLSREWPALKQALETVEKTHPPAAAQLQQLIAARPGPDLANSLLFLMAALRLGGAKAWLSPDARALLGRGEADIAARLVDDFGALSRLATETNSGDWKAYFLPFHDGEVLRQLRIFTRRQKQQSGDGDEDAATRFVVEVDLSRLGPMQLDGLSHDGRFDLIVRTRASLPADIRKTIAGIFDSFRRSGLSGEIGFQADPVFPVAPLEEIGDGHIGVVA